LNTLEISNTDEFVSLNLVANLATMLASYYKGFTIIISDSVLNFNCLDASLAI
jgi:hypothetical protein